MWASSDCFVFCSSFSRLPCPAVSLLLYGLSVHCPLHSQFTDESRYYIASDINILLDIIKNEIAFLKTNWKMLGRPTLVLPLRSSIIRGKSIASLDHYYSCITLSCCMLHPAASPLSLSHPFKRCSSHYWQSTNHQY